MTRDTAKALVGFILNVLDGLAAATWNPIDNYVVKLVRYREERIVDCLMAYLGKLDSPALDAVSGLLLKGVVELEALKAKLVPEEKLLEAAKVEE